MPHAPCSLLSALCSLLPAPCSLLPAPCSLLPAPCSLLPAPCSLLLHAPCRAFLPVFQLNINRIQCVSYFVRGSPVFIFSCLLTHLDHQLHKAIQLFHVIIVFCAFIF